MRWERRRGRMEDKEGRISRRRKGDRRKEPDGQEKKGKKKVNQ